MGRLSRSKREGGKRDKAVKRRSAGIGGGGKESDSMRLVDMAEYVLDAMHRDQRKRPARQDAGAPEGALLGSEWIEYPFVHEGKRHRVSLPAVLLKSSGHDFQLGCIYGMLLQRLKPKMVKCQDCGEMQEPMYGFVDREVVGGDYGTHRD